MLNEDTEREVECDETDEEVDSDDPELEAEMAEMELDDTKWKVEYQYMLEVGDEVNDEPQTPTELGVA